VPEFRVISEKTIFHPDRTITKKPDIISAPVLLPMIKPILVGTVVSANGAKAYFNDPTTKITRPYRVDDSVFGYKVQDIGDSKVILSSGNRKVELNLGKVENVQGTQGGNTLKRIYGNQILKRLFQSYDETPLPASMSSGSKKK
jgi:hypothetical protein